jgi:hypothetical protein
MGRISGKNVLNMLEKVPRAERVGFSKNKPMPARWPTGLAQERMDQVKQVFDLRNWSSQLHEGSRMVAEGFIKEET